MTRRSRVGKHQLDELARSLGRLDRQLLDEVARFRLMSAKQLQRLHFGPHAKDDRRCRRRLNRLVELGVLDQLPRRVGGRGRGSDSTVVRVGRIGRRLLGLSGSSGPAWQPSAMFAAHTLGVVDAYADVVDQARFGSIALVEFTPEPDAWRSFAWGMKSVTLKPDAFAVISVGGVQHHYFVELDLGTESMTVIGDKISRYLDYYQSGPGLEVFPQVLFLVDSATLTTLAARANESRRSANRLPERYRTDSPSWSPWPPRTIRRGSLTKLPELTIKETKGGDHE